jgi:hypothetical protein
MNPNDLLTFIVIIGVTLVMLVWVSKRQGTPKRS